MIIRYIFPQFEQSILDDEKIHTFRRDPKKRWRAGMSIQHYMYSYMNPNSYKFLENQCFAVQSVEIVHVKGPHRWRMGGVEHKFFELAMLIDGRTLYLDDECLPIIQNDGLTKEEFITFFVPNAVDLSDSIELYTEAKELEAQKAGWVGRIIHWTEKRY